MAAPRSRKPVQKSPARRIQREIDEILNRPAAPRQRLLFITFEPAKTFSKVRAVPLPVDFSAADVARVWTLYNDNDKDHPPKLPVYPKHLQNAFLEDRGHDWNIVDGKFRYGSRVMDRDVWVLVELK